MNVVSTRPGGVTAWLEGREAESSAAARIWFHFLIEGKQKMRADHGRSLWISLPRKSS